MSLALACGTFGALQLRVDMEILQGLKIAHITVSLTLLARALILWHSEPQVWISISMCFEQKTPKQAYNYREGTLLSVFLWLRLTPAKVLVSVAYEPGRSTAAELTEFNQQLCKLGAEVKLFPVDPSSTCDCITLALWLRLLAFQDPRLQEEDLMMISESDVFVTSAHILRPLQAPYRAWLYWAEPALYGQSFAMSFTTLVVSDWRLLLLNSSSCEQAMDTFSDVTDVWMIGDWTKQFYGKNWESDQNVVTAQLLRMGLCTVPDQSGKMLSNYLAPHGGWRLGQRDTTCWKGQGFGECRAVNLGNTWYSAIGDCPWYHHWFPLALLESITTATGEQEFLEIFRDHLFHNSGLERIFFDHHNPNP